MVVAHAASLFNREIELEEGSARVSWYETQLLIGQPNGGSPKFQGVSPKIILISEGLVQKHIYKQNQVDWLGD